MRVRDVMTKDVLVLDVKATYQQAVQLMITHRVSGLPVVGQDNKLVGVVTEADLMSKEAFDERLRPVDILLSFITGDRRWTGRAAALTAGELMSTEVVTIGPDDEVGTAARRMLQHGIKRLPVVEGGRIVGIVARHDLLNSFHRADREIAAETAARLDELTWERPGPKAG
jgi:CBS domain-containing protein